MPHPFACLSLVALLSSTVLAQDPGPNRGRTPPGPERGERAEREEQKRGRMERSERKERPNTEPRREQREQTADQGKPGDGGGARSGRRDGDIVGDKDARGERGAWRDDPMAAQLLRMMDRNGDGTIEPAEAARFRALCEHVMHAARERQGDGEGAARQQGQPRQGRQEPSGDQPRGDTPRQAGDGEPPAMQPMGRRRGDEPRAGDGGRRGRS